MHRTPERLRVSVPAGRWGARRVRTDGFRPRASCRGALCPASRGRPCRWSWAGRTSPGEHSSRRKAASLESRLASSAESWVASRAAVLSLPAMFAPGGAPLRAAIDRATLTLQRWVSSVTVPVYVVPRSNSLRTASVRYSCGGARSSAVQSSHRRSSCLDARRSCRSRPRVLKQEDAMRLLNPVLPLAIVWRAGTHRCEYLEGAGEPGPCPALRRIGPQDGTRGHDD